MKNLKTILLTFIVLFLSVCDYSYAAAKENYYEVVYNVQIKSTKKTENKDVKIWVPFLKDYKDFQKIENFKIENINNDYKFTEDRKWGNKILFFTYNGNKDLNLKITYNLKRKEILLQDIKKTLLESIALDEKYLEASQLMVQNKRVKRFAENAVKNSKDKVRAIYDFVLENMEYNKQEPGYGKGDVNRICLSIGKGSQGKGNCTDFHSFFISLLHSLQIPAFFEMGFPLTDLKEGKVVEAGYHCWAWFYDLGYGFIPVDISEADKNPEKKDYFFGSLDASRVTFSLGRDIILNPVQKGEPLNFFGPDPYIEIDGQPFYDFQRTIIFHKK